MQNRCPLLFRSIAFPDRQIAFPKSHIAFPERHNAFPCVQCALQKMQFLSKPVQQALRRGYFGLRVIHYWLVPGGGLLRRNPPQGVFPLHYRKGATCSAEGAKGHGESAYVLLSVIFSLLPDFPYFRTTHPPVPLGFAPPALVQPLVIMIVDNSYKNLISELKNKNVIIWVGAGY